MENVISGFSPSNVPRLSVADLICVESKAINDTTRHIASDAVIFRIQHQIVRSGIPDIKETFEDISSITLCRIVIRGKIKPVSVKILSLVFLGAA